MTERVKNELLYCDSCKWLYPTEVEQEKIEDEGTYPHRCKYYCKRVFHFGHHPHILRLDGCNAYAIKSLNLGG